MALLIVVKNGFLLVEERSWVTYCFHEGRTLAGVDFLKKKISWKGASEEIVVCFHCCFWKGRNEK